LQSRFPHVNAGRGKTANLWLSRGQNFSPASLPGFFSFIKSQPQHAGLHHAIFRASAFIACLTSTQLPMGDLQFLHDMTVSLEPISKLPTAVDPL
jgi:hypothetical protein